MDKGIGNPKIQLGQKVASRQEADIQELFPLWGKKLSLLRVKTEGGSGGKRGHSNMDHWVTTEEVKTAARKQRRLDVKEIISKELSDEAKAQRDTADCESAD